MHPPRLIALTTGEPRRARDGRLRDAVLRAASEGLRAVLVREPALADGPLLELLRDLRGRLPTDAWLGVHDRPHLAQLCGAQAVHLGFRSLDAASFRSGFGASLAVGLSTHAEDDPAAWAEGDYAFHGPLRETASHPPGSPGFREAVGLEGLAAAVRESPVPVLALGGVRPADVPDVRATGAHGVAVLSGLLGSPDPAAAAARYLDALGGES